MNTYDIYLLPHDKNIAVGSNASLEEEILDTLRRIEDETYGYVGEVRLKVKPSYWESLSHNGC